ncbi:MAG: hypothetical protein HSCHL_0106 [Hydrogenibacillus schlegelii]|uniref:Uncharacterized protein n=1 Tax=Hydrogenibacillus schlegelii TaxID=1484 RepID=A0A2T5GEB2_HYDSH|nr:MAG: hypothetical protein HSCHL_0106 [Hydrogenibacillus schlegelii]
MAEGLKARRQPFGDGRLAGPFDPFQRDQPLMDGNRRRLLRSLVRSSQFVYHSIRIRPPAMVRSA